MKYQIFEAVNIWVNHIDRAYIFTTSEWFSSNFDSLEQLCEVGLDDPDKVVNDLNCRLDEKYSDCTFLFETDDLETVKQNFPEFFI